MTYFSHELGLDETSEQLLKDVCMLVDKNHDNTVDFAEFKTVYPISTSTFFNQLDSNANDTLELSEFRQWFVLADGSLDADQLTKLKKELEDSMFSEEFNLLLSL